MAKKFNNNNSGEFGAKHEEGTHNGFL